MGRARARMKLGQCRVGSMRRGAEIAKQVGLFFHGVYGHGVSRSLFS
jgi:hypothetical protein